MRRILGCALAGAVAACSAPIHGPDQVPADPPELVPVSPQTLDPITTTPEEAKQAPEPPVWRFLRERYDANHDGRITPDEYRRGPESYARLDADGDGVVTIADFDPKWTGVPRVADFQYGEGGPEEGAEAPDFRLQAPDGSTIQLSSFRGKKPVVLVFGSFT